MMIGAALIVLDRAQDGPVALWYVVLNVLSGVGFLSLIISHVRSALRASRGLASLRNLPDEDLDP
jgi:hypothetical protein